MRKYEFTGETCEHHGVTLQRIRAVIDIPGVVDAGELGGWLEHEDNLSHNGECWVCDDAKVYGDAEVCDSAKVCADARVYGCARVYGDAEVCDSAKVCADARVYGCARVYGDANVCGNAEVRGNAEVSDCAWVYGNTNVCDDAEVHGNAKVYACARVYGHARVYGDANVCGAAEVYGYVQLVDGVLAANRCYVAVGPIGSRNAFTTFNLVSGTVCAGCFKGSLDAFEKAVHETHGDNEHADDYNRLIAYFKTLRNNQRKMNMKENEPEITVTATMPVKCAYVLKDELLRQASMLYDKVATLADIDSKRTAVHYADAMYVLSSKLGEQLAGAEGARAWAKATVAGSVGKPAAAESDEEKPGAGLLVPVGAVVRLINNFHENVVMDTSGDKFTVVAIYDDTYHDPCDIRLVAADDESRVLVPADVFAAGRWSIEKVGDGTLRLRCEKPSRPGVFWEGVLYSSCARIVDVLES